MSLPTMTGVGRLTGEPELRVAQTGTFVCRVPLAFNSRRKDGNGEWVDGDTFFVTGTVFGDMAERVAESLSKGTEVLVTGRLKTRKYTDRDGNDRSVVDLMVDSIGPSMRWANVKVAKLARKSAVDAAAEDTWETLAPVGAGNVDDEIPF